MAEIERKQGRLSYLVAATAVLAIAVAGAALALAIIGQGKYATQDDVDKVNSSITSLKTEVSKATQDQIKGVSSKISALQSQVSDLSTKQGADATSIAELQSKIDSLNSKSNSAFPPAVNGAKP